MPELGGIWSDRLADVRPQERVQRHTVDQIVDAVRLPTLDVPVPQVEQLVEVLMMPDVEQVIEVPKVVLEDGIPRRAELREPRVVGLQRDLARLEQVR